MSTPHKHAAVIKAWADGAKIQFRNAEPRTWIDIAEGHQPLWALEMQYRVKPEPKPDVVRLQRVYYHETVGVMGRQGTSPEWEANVEFTFDGETSKLKGVKLI